MIRLETGGSLIAKPISHPVIGQQLPSAATQLVGVQVVDAQNTTFQERSLWKELKPNERNLSLELG